ncbi:hypothetical protein QZH41_020001 [Actinostola sp. cb2023]|nr:hypothetical protein QZH41_020001 [Actinostola sp. cb2023]
MYTSLVDSVTAAMTPTKRGSNNRNCAVPLCRSYGNLFDKEHNRKVTYHAIPKASNEKRLWLTKIRREEKSGFKTRIWKDQGILAVVTTKGRFSIREFAHPSLFRPFAISMSLHFFQQFSGINAVMFYCATIFEKAGFQDKSTFVSIIIGVVQFVSSVVSLFIIDRGGRRFLLLSASTSMTINCFVAGLYFYLTSNGADGGFDLSWMAVTALSVYIVAFASGWGPCTWLMMSEILPLRARGTASGIATFFNWFCSFIVTKTFSYMISELTESGTFWFFGVMMFFSIFFVYYFVPETKGKSLEEIQIYFESFGKKKKPVRESRL